MTTEPADLAIPVLPSSDPAKTVALWQAAGFAECAVYPEAGYGIARSGGVDVTVVGRVEQGRGLVVLDSQGRPMDLPVLGYSHG